MKVISYTYCKECGTEEIFNIGDLKHPDKDASMRALKSAQKHATHKQISVTFSYDAPEDLQEYVEKGILTKELLYRITKD